MKSVGPFYESFLVVAVTNSPKHDFNRCKSTTCKFLSRDTKSARDKNGTKPRKNKVKNTSLEISLVEYLCFVCKGTNLSLEKRELAIEPKICHPYCPILGLVNV